MQQWRLAHDEHERGDGCRDGWATNVFAVPGAYAWRWDAATRRLDVSPAARDLLGVVPDTIEELAAAVHDEDRVERDRAFGRALAGGGSWEASFRVDGAEGVRWIDERGRALTDGDGAVVAVIALAVDVTRHHDRAHALRCRLETERRDLAAAQQATGSAEAALQALARSEAFLESMFASMADGLVLYDTDGRMARVNPAACEMLGYRGRGPTSSNDALLAHLNVFDIDGRPVPSDRLPVVAALRGETSRGVPLMFRHGDGHKVWATVGAAPIRTPDGTVVGAVLSLGDVTRLRDLQEQREDLSRMIAHDLRAPLGTIIGQAKLLGRRAESAEVVQGRAETIVTSAQRMSAMLNDLVESALLETGKLRLDLDQVNVAEMARDLRGRVAPPLDGERIHVDVAERVPHVTADANRLERVFVNLFTNALKYSAPATPVTVRVGAQGDDVVVEVEDRGQGIAAEDVPHLFERYFRARSSFRFEGMGLGLYTARMLVEAHGGTIEVSTVAGRGSTFRVRLPIRPLPR